MLCACGCGRETQLARFTMKKRGWIKGRPLKFCKGHRISKFNRVPDYVVLDMGYKTPCWMWQKTMSREGYGKFRSTPSEMKYAHRHFYETAKGPISEGSHLDHLCRHRGCVNPGHLEEVSSAANARRGLQSKITEQDAMSIREMRSKGMKTTDIAKLFGLHQSQVSRIATGKRWSPFLL
jgi:hypothetical protein